MGQGYLDADVASEALAACSVVAAAEGAGLPSDAPVALLAKVAAEAAQVKSSNLAASCQSIVRRAASEQSELAELWAEAEPGEFRGFEAALADLKARLPDVAPAPLAAGRGQPGPVLTYGLDLPVTSEALMAWVQASFKILEARSGVALDAPALPQDNITAFMTAAADRAARLALALDLPPYADGEQIPTDDASPGGLRFYEVCLAGHFRRIEAYLNGGEDE